MTLTVIISIHALRGEGDGIRYIDGGKLKEFQSTPSVGRATTQAGIQYAKGGISIHALRGEGDRREPRRERSANDDFNPRPPWGGRPEKGISS